MRLATFALRFLARILLVWLVLALQGFDGSASASTGTHLCRASQLRITLGPLLSPPSGQHPLAFRVTDRGPTTCHLRGYPSVVLVDGRGRVLPFVVRNRGDLVVTSRPPTDVRVRSGHSAWVVLNKYRCDRRDLRVARAVRVGLPGDRRSDGLRLALRSDSSIAYCGKGDPGSKIAVSPVEPTLRAALAH
jgi:hypothetical protein